MKKTPFWQVSAPIFVSLALTACQAPVNTGTRPTPGPSPSSVSSPSPRPGDNPSLSPANPSPGPTATPLASPSPAGGLTLNGRSDDSGGGGLEKIIVTPLDGSAPAQTFRPSSGGDFSLADVPAGKDLRLELRFSDSGIYVYQLKAAAIEPGRRLLITRANGPYFEGDTPPPRATLTGAVLTQPGFAAGQMTKIRLRSLDPVNHPYEATIYTHAACGDETAESSYRIAGVPPLTPVEVTAEFANFQPKVYTLTSADGGKVFEQDLVASLIQADFLTRLQSPGFESLQPGQSTTLVNFYGVVTNTVTGAVYRAVSLDARVPYSQSVDIQEGHFRLDLPVGVDIKLTTTFDGNQLSVPFDGTLERSIHVLVSDPRFNLPSPYAGFTDTLGPSSATIRQEFDSGYKFPCDLSYSAKTFATGTVTNYQGQAVAGVKVTVKASPALLALYKAKDGTYYEVTATTGPSGKFTLPGLIPGASYDLTATLGNQSLTRSFTPMSHVQGDPSKNKLNLKLSN